MSTTPVPPTTPATSVPPATPSTDPATPSTEPATPSTDPARLTGGPADPVERSAPDPREVFADRIVESLVHSLEAHCAFLGLELGLYRALRDAGPSTADQLAERCGIHGRYAREWLEQQAAAGVLRVVHDPGREPSFQLPDAQAEVLVDADSPFNVSGGVRMLAGVASVIDRLPVAYRGGRGIPYADFGLQIRHGIASFNRPMFRHDLGSTWLPAVAEIHERLTAPTRARVLDLGCGVGLSSLAIAEAYPGTEVVGVDLDPVSVAEAEEAARDHPARDRVRFVAGDAARVAGPAGSFDVVTIFEALHDMGDPVGALRTARTLLAPGGGVLVADERVEEEFTADAGLVERFNYGWSVLHCLPATMAERPVEANGTVLRSRTVRRWAAEAGFGRCVVLDLENPFWRFYHLGD